MLKLKIGDRVQLRKESDWSSLPQWRGPGTVIGFWTDGATLLKHPQVKFDLSREDGGFFSYHFEALEDAEGLFAKERE